MPGYHKEIILIQKAGQYCVRHVNLSGYTVGEDHPRDPDNTLCPTLFHKNDMGGGELMEK